MTVQDRWHGKCRIISLGRKREGKKVRKNGGREDIWEREKEGELKREKKDRKEKGREI